MIIDQGTDLSFYIKLIHIDGTELTPRLVTNLRVKLFTINEERCVTIGADNDGLVKATSKLLEILPSGVIVYSCSYVYEGYAYDNANVYTNFYWRKMNEDDPNMDLILSELSSKADYVYISNNIYTKKEVDDLIGGGIDLSNYFTKDESDARYLTVGDYVTSRELRETVNDLIGAAPEALNTLEEIANKLSNNDDAVAAIVNTMTDKADKSEIPTKTSDLTNDSGFITQHQDLTSYITKNEVYSNYQLKGDYAKSSDVYTKAEIDDKIDEVDTTQYYTKQETDNKFVTNNWVITNVPTKSEIEQIIQEGGLTKELADTYYQPKGNYLTEHQSLAGLARSSDVYSKAQADARFVDSSEVQSEINQAVQNIDLEGYAKTTDIPTKTSLLTNDSGFITEHLDISGKADKSDTYTKAEVDTKISQSGTFDPTQYYTKSDIDEAGYLTEHQSLADYAKKNELFSKSYNDLTNKPAIPTKVSDLTNDAGYLTEHQDITGKANVGDSYTKAQSDEKYQPVGNYLTEHQSLTDYATKAYLNGKLEDVLGINAEGVSALKALTEDDDDATGLLKEIGKKANSLDLHSVAYSGSYNDLKNKPTIPDAYTKLETDDLISDTKRWVEGKNYLTAHLDISGKADKSDTYTKAEVDAKVSQSGTFDPTQYYNKTAIDEMMPTKTSDLTNDSGFLTAHQDISGKADKSELFSKDYNDLINKPDLFSGSYNDLTNKPTIPAAQIQSNWNLEDISKLDYIKNKPTIPTKTSDLTNDSGYLTAHLDISGKQDTLVSGTNIKTINNQSILGEGNITIGGGSGTIDSDMSDSSTNAVQNKVIKAYVDGLIGDIDTVLDSIIGE